MSGICQEFFFIILFMKDFDSWNQKKKAIETFSENRFHFHEKEIWWASLGLNVGDEQDGKNELFERPVLILKKFNKKIAWIVPLTTKAKTGPYYYSIHNPGVEKSSYLILSQLRLLSAKRLRRRMGKITGAQNKNIKMKFIGILFPQQNRSLFSEAPRGPSGHL